MKYTKRKSVPINYREDWAYRGHWGERKIAPGKWVFKFTATKNRRSGKGGPKPGSKIVWGIRNVEQRVVKTKRGQYQTVMTGIKFLKRAKIR